MMKGFLEYVPGDSFLHRMNPVAKLGAALLLVIATFATGNFVLLALLAVLDVVLAAQCKMLPQTLGLARAVALFCQDRIKIDGRSVRILPPQEETE